MNSPFRDEAMPAESQAQNLSGLAGSETCYTLHCSFFLSSSFAVLSARSVCLGGLELCLRLSDFLAVRELYRMRSTDSISIAKTNPDRPPAALCMQRLRNSHEMTMSRAPLCILAGNLRLCGQTGLQSVSML